MYQLPALSSLNDAHFQFDFVRDRICHAASDTRGRSG